MQFEEKIEIKSLADVIFNQYAHVETWNTWDSDVKSSCISGEFQKGTEGVLIPAQGAKAKFKLTQVSPNTCFTLQTKLPFCTMQFEHELKQCGEVTQVLHRVSFMGPMSFLWSRVIGKQIKKNLPQVLKKLKALCEEKTGNEGI